MKTRITLLFTASLVSINMVPSSNADLDAARSGDAYAGLHQATETRAHQRLEKAQTPRGLNQDAPGQALRTLDLQKLVAEPDKPAQNYAVPMPTVGALDAAAIGEARADPQELATAADTPALLERLTDNPLAVGAAFEARPDQAVAVQPVADQAAAVEPVAVQPVAAGAAKISTILEEPEQKFAVPAPIVAAANIAPAAIETDNQPAAVFSAVEMAVQQAPTPESKAAALSEIKLAAAALPIAQPVTETAPIAAAPVKLPDAPSYIYFDEADAAVAQGGAGGSSANYSSENVSLEQAIAAALETNPEVNQAIQNKEAIEFEREQAQAQYLPRVDLEASGGIRRLENSTRRSLGIADNELYPVEIGIVAEQNLFDFGRRRGELRRQAARTDGAALRVAERSENIALLVTRQYLDILLQQRIVAAAEDNVTFHRNLVRDLGQGVQQGSISIADQQQAQERLQAAVVRKAEAEEAMVNAQISLQTLTGLSVNSVTVPPSKRAALLPTVNDAIAQARQENPRVLEAMADVDAAHAVIQAAKGDLHPTIGLEGRGRIGNDTDGFRDETNDLQARIVLRWNIFDGGTNRARVQEMVRRASESRFRLHELIRIAEEDVRRAWNSMSTQDKVGQELEVQSRVSDDLLLSYREQFNVGRRSLLDVLDAQNTRHNVQVRLETARFAEQFAEYQVLAATNNLLDSMSLAAPSAAKAYAREKYEYGPSDPAETDRRRYPK